MSLLLPSSPAIHRFAGTLIGPDDEGYGALIARCESVADVAAALAHARAHGLEVAVRAGGHSSPDGGLVIDLSPLKAVQVDPVRRIAWVQPGVLWSELDAATQEHGLAVTGGRVSSTGVAGFTLGPGSGWLERKMGLASDNLRAARVLTADGQIVKASATDNPDLFWALRGGGGDFGIVVELEFALRPVGPIVLGGMLLWPRDRAGEVMRAYRDLMADAPDALCGGLALMTAAHELEGRPAVGVIVLYAGDPERGLEHVGRLRALAPAVDAVQPMPYCAVQSMLDGAHLEGLRAGFVDELDDAAIETIAAASEDMLLQPLGGAFGRVGELETAIGHRDAAWGVWSRTASFVVDDAAGAERHARLVEAKDRWDPEKVFA